VKRKSLHFGLFEVGLITVTITAVALSLHRPPPPVSAEITWLAQTYGPHRQSQYYEEWIARDFFHDRRGGVFVDVGAADPKLLSNTWYLEHGLGWSGLAVDAQAEYGGGYATARPRTRFRPFFVADRSSERAKLYLNDTPIVASSEPTFTGRWGAVRDVREVPTITLDDMLDAERVAAIDFLSIDIELAEPQALAGFSINRFKPRLVCIEAHPEVRQRILDYFAANGYVIVGKYLPVDRENLWFMPAGTTVEPFPAEPLAGGRDLHEARRFWPW
jgi:FkbM family methyltransferase